MPWNFPALCFFHYVFFFFNLLYSSCGLSAIWGLIEDHSPGESLSSEELFPRGKEEARIHRSFVRGKKKKLNPRNHIAEHPWITANHKKTVSSFELTSLCMIISTSIHVATNGSMLFFFMAE